MSYRQTLQLLWRDENNRECTQFAHTISNPEAVLGSAAAFVTAAAAMSVAGLEAVWVAPCIFTDGSPGSGPYNNRDKAQLTFRAANGQVVRINIPAPRGDIWLDDSTTLDLSNPLVEAVVSGAMTGLASSAGSELVAVVSGVRTRVRT